MLMIAKSERDVKADEVSEEGASNVTCEDLLLAKEDTLLSINMTGSTKFLFWKVRELLLMKRGMNCR